ncbi:MAG: superoxide dismutase family protein [Pirellulales bacterium]|nr:superoxide dismutase family protein [Pirellulales bacterium]
MLSITHHSVVALQTALLIASIHNVGQAQIRPTVRARVHASEHIHQKQQAEAVAAVPAVTHAVAVVIPLGESKVKGKVTFTQVKGGVEIVAELTGLSPGDHGFHVHEFGDCSMADGKCAGGHFNPTGAPHAGPDSDQRHVGDLGNVTADAEGKALYKRVDKLITLSGPHSIIGRSVIVHAKLDDLTTQQPPGNAGDRIACGVIGIADPKMHAGH